MNEHQLAYVRGVEGQLTGKQSKADRLKAAKRKVSELKESLSDSEFFDIPVEYKGPRNYNFVVVGLNDEIKTMIEERERLFNLAYKQESLIREASVAAFTRDKLAEIERQIIESEAEVVELRSGLNACDNRLTEQVAKVDND